MITLVVKAHLRVQAGFRLVTHLYVLWSEEKLKNTSDFELSWKMNKK